MFATSLMRGRQWDVALGAVFASLSAGGAVILMDSAFDRGWGLGLALFALGVVGAAAVVTGNWRAKRAVLQSADCVDTGRPVGTRERLLIIVRQDRDDMLDTLQAMFADQGDVQIVMEQRSGERRQCDVTPAEDRRRSERRSHLEVDAAIEQRGWAVLRVPASD